MLTIPAELCLADARGDVKQGEYWMVALVEQDADRSRLGLPKTSTVASLVLLNQKTLAMAYWPLVFGDGHSPAVVVISGTEESGDVQSSTVANRRSSTSWSAASGNSVENHVKSMVATALPGVAGKCCAAIAGRSTGELYRFDCSPHEVTRSQIGRSLDDTARGGIGIISLNSSPMRCLAWSSPTSLGRRQFLLLTAKGLECWDVELGGCRAVSLAWTHDFIVDNASNSAEKMRDSVHKEFAGQKQVWLLDLQVDARGKEFIVLVASFCKDRINNSNYMQYSLLTFFLHGVTPARVEELATTAPPVVKKTSMQVILPKARVEEETSLYSMRLHIGGKPAGSVMITAEDGTATVAHPGWTGSLRLYQFTVPWDVGKVLDVSVIPPLEDEDEGSWLVLTEKAGVWIIPEKVVLLGGVEPPQKNLSRRGSLIEEATTQERKKKTSGNFALRKVSLETADDSQESQFFKNSQAHTSQDEETDEIVWLLLQQFASSGQVDNAFEKLHKVRAFDREGNASVFARTSKSIVDTLGKHWTRGVDSGSSIVCSQFVEKQRQHQQYLNFLAASGCHEELQTRQREALQIIMEHGEKLAAIIKLRELHNSRAQALNSFTEGSEDRFTASKSNEIVGALWDTVQLVGEKLRRNNAVLLNREKAEVFYSRVSEAEEFFTCIEHHGEALVEQEQQPQQRAGRLIQLIDACTQSLRASIHYRDSHQLWYPPPEGLTPWYCSPTVRLGLWKLTQSAIKLKSQLATSHADIARELCTRLEEVSDMMLEGYAGAIKAKIERGEEYRGLQGEYGMKRDVLLEVLHQQVRALSTSGGWIGTPQESSMVDKIYDSLIALAQRHAGYQTLYEICTDLNDFEQLKKLMHESMGAREGSFCYYVFEQCYKNQQFARLLTLGEEFQVELHKFLHDHKDVAWLHDLFLNKFSSASQTLQSLALSSSKGLEVGRDVWHQSPESIVEPLTPVERKHMMYLAKIAALAAGGHAAKAEAALLDARIAILHVQEQVVQAGMIGDDEMLSPRQLIEACMKLDNKELVLSVFEVFAYAGDDFRQRNKSLLENAWVWAADQDDWGMMRETSENEGWGDQQLLNFMYSTGLYQAARRCYGEGADARYGGPFEETLSLTSGDGAGLSVEVILMRHPDFSFAGQTMLTALKLGTEPSAEWASFT